jgi:4-amino-4-deoxy-L-arabinose transferase-like glycosyltransferase
MLNSKPTGYFSTIGPLGALALLTGLSIVLRLFSFIPAVIDHDESTYIVIADALRGGDVYLRDVIDTKPIGIFTLFALFQILFGKSILVIRLMAAIWVALSGWMLYLVHRQIIKTSSTSVVNSAPIASGLIYVIGLSVFTSFGVSPNTEHFFALFAVSALFIVLRWTGPGWFLLSGLLLGIGFMIKYVVLFDALAIGFFYLWLQVTDGKKWVYWLSRCILMGIGYLIPFTMVWIYYRHLGMEEIFLHYTFNVSGEYFIRPPWYKYVTYVLEGLGRLFPLTIWFIYCSWNWRITGPKLPVLSWLWAGLVLFIILLPGKLFSHYFIQFMLPLSLLAGSFFDRRRSPGRALAWIRKPALGYALLGIIVVVNVALQRKDYALKRDYPREVAAYLNESLQPGDVIYTANAYQILYHLTGTKSPTPYIHPSLLWTDENNLALGIDRREEWNKILAQQPRYIIIKKKLPEGNLMLETLEASYHLVKSFDETVKVFERN